jgi:hypothetical protein
MERNATRKAAKKHTHFDCKEVMQSARHVPYHPRQTLHLLAIKTNHCTADIWDLFFELSYSQCIQK